MAAVAVPERSGPGCRWKRRRLPCLERKQL